METQDLFSRDLSWLAFNHRVLQEAKDPSVPLYERIKFLAIYSSNLDEFFRVRVASLRSFKELKKETRREMALKPKKELKQIRKIVEQQQREFGSIFRGTILPELEKRNIFLIKETAYTTSQETFCKKFFFEKLYPHLQPVFIDPTAEKAPFLKNKGLYFVLSFPDTELIALVEIPTQDIPRFVALPSENGRHDITFVDDIIRTHLKEVVHREPEGVYSVKLSRDAEIYIEDEFSGDLLEKIKKGLKERNVGLPTRFLYDNEMPEDLLARLKFVFRLTKNDLIPGARYHNFNDFFSFPDPTHSPDLHDEPLPPLPHPELEDAPSITDLLRKKDVLLHFPYQKYDYIPRWIQEAADDPDVLSIKITLYRVASKSAVVEALLRAREKGKQVMVFIEAKARFDEESNIYWGEELEKAKASVFYSYPGIKVHSKLLLINRQEETGIRHYAYLGTGNFNEKTARIYTDHALLTSDSRLSHGVVQVFDLLERKIIIPSKTDLFISPFTLRNRFEELIDREIAHAKAGKIAYLIIKLNNLEDAAMVRKLYEASQAGVEVRMIIRGICCLITGLKGESENITVTSIIDRFLEHARVYIFANGGEEEMYLASADWMNRNLDRRVEVAFPVYDPALREELRTIIQIQLSDNTKARFLDTGQTNPYVPSKPVEPKVRAQAAIYHFLKNKWENRFLTSG